MSDDVLGRILADKRARLARGEYAAAGAAARPSDGASFTASLREPGTRIVAEIKAKYDPDNVFHLNQNIRPDVGGVPAP